MLFSLLCLPTFSYGEDVDLSFTKGDTAFILKITNQTTDDIFVRNMTNVAVNGSVLVVRFFDQDGVLLNKHGDEWGLGKESGFWIKKGATQQFDYEISKITRDFTHVKKVMARVSLRYYILNQSGSFLQIENFECDF